MAAEEWGMHGGSADMAILHQNSWQWLLSAPYLPVSEAAPLEEQVAAGHRPDLARLLQPAGQQAVSATCTHGSKETPSTHPSEQG